MRCACCGRFFKMQPGCAWKMVYSGWPPGPSEEIYKCKKCVETDGPFEPQHGIRPEASCGIFKR
jgi:hypothetical protein